MSAPRLLLMLVLVSLSACDIGQVTVAEPVSSVIAEVYLRIDDGIPDGVALLHRTTGSDQIPVQGAVIEIQGEGPQVGRFAEQSLEDCIDGELPLDFEPICLRLVGPSRSLVQPGATLSVRVELPEGQRLEGVVTMPSDFEIVQPLTAPGLCNLPSGSVLPVLWTQSEGAWAYVPEAEINGLRDAFAEQGIEVPSDPVTLLGLSVSQSDTTIAFPSEFGIFNRFSGDREVLVALQGGLPPSSDLEGRVVVSAQERNATNWNRGGIFNPSGQVRVPSLFGEGTGVAAGVVNRSFGFAVNASGDFPDCAV
ncbi:MAG: hypothetical protein EA351_09070 [Gemmatimonadales bacterium]|nr:MAG: hypothetical protein EA351_09070 [Gemmatimonadales bacterium]